MKLPELLQSLNRISANGLSRHAQPEVVIPIYQPGRLGGQFAVPVTHVNLGFDWDQGKLFLESDEKLTLLSAEEVEDIRKHASLGQNRESHQRYVMLTNLLARIHRDGGQYVRQHGIDKAFADADAIVAELYAAPVSEANPQAEAFKPEELRIDTYHAGEHSGFLHTNETAVRITHLPTGAYVESKDERSVHRNKQKCLDMLPAAIEAKAQCVVMPERWNVPRPMWKDARQPYGNPLNHADIEAAEKFNLALDEVVRLNAAPVQQVSVPAWMASSRAFADRLYMAGWRDHADAQHSGVAGMYDELLSSAPAAPAARRDQGVPSAKS